ncbi:MAG: M20 family peptidase [Leptonema sp. (in: bacteria)]
MKLRGIFILVLVSISILAMVILIKTITFKEPTIQKASKPAFLEIEEFQKAQQNFINNLSKAITFKTISFQELEKRNLREFENFILFVQKSFPKTFNNLEFKKINQYTILLKWEGKDPQKKPVVLMGHYDVVPANELEWNYPPFEGKIVDNYLYGRGAIDDKITVIGLLQATEFLLNTGFKPERTIFFSFGHDEEINGFEGAKAVVEYLEKNQIFPEFVLDEGGAITVGIVPGIQKPVATIGIAEKGYLSLKLTSKGKGGHSSTPSEKTAIGNLVEALHRLSQKPFPYNLTPVQEKMFEYMGPHFPFVQKIAFANLWIFKNLILSQLRKSDSARASLHTTMVPTIINAGVKENVIPTTAEAVINFRILPGDSKEKIKKYIQEITKELDIEISELPFSSEPSPVSGTEGEEGIGFRKISEAIKTINSDFVIAPYLVLGATDARHFTKITKNTYRFLPIYLTEEDMKAMHGNNERISLESLKIALEFYTILINNL